jgi:hypothetical protein
MYQMGLRLDEAEGFRKDAFGNEHITGVVTWESLQNKPLIMLITTSGYFKVFKAEMLLPRLEQQGAYNIDRLKGGYPLAILAVAEHDAVTVFSAAGRALRVCMREWPFDEGRLMRVAMQEPLIAAFSTSDDQHFIAAGADANAKHITPEQIPTSQTLGGQGAKIRPNLCAVAPFDAPLYAITSKRILPVESVKLEALRTKARSLVKLSAGESLTHVMSI